jgi:hypothetical protein
VGYLRRSTQPEIPGGLRAERAAILGRNGRRADWNRQEGSGNVRAPSKSFQTGLRQTFPLARARAGTRRGPIRRGPMAGAGERLSRSNRLRPLTGIPPGTPPWRAPVAGATRAGGPAQSRLSCSEGPPGRRGPTGPHRSPFGPRKTPFGASADPRKPIWSPAGAQKTLAGPSVEPRWSAENLAWSLGGPSMEPREPLDGPSPEPGKPSLDPRRRAKKPGWIPSSGAAASSVPAISR